MEQPGVSMFNPGVSLHLDTVNQQEREEEEEDEEERRRIDAELKERLEGAFDDLDLEEDDDEEEDDEEARGGTPGQGRLAEMDMVTPGQAPLKYMTSTPYIPHTNTFQAGYNANQFHQLAVEETEYEHETVTNGREIEENYQDNYMKMDRANQQQQQYSEGGVGGVGGGPDMLNKSDIEKAMEKRIVSSGNSDPSDLMVLYTARGREIQRLEEEGEKTRESLAGQIRNLRHQLALATAEKHQQASSCGQLEQLLADSRRENKAVTEEIHGLKERLRTVEEERDSCQQQLEGGTEAVTQLQQQLHQLQTSDTVLRARQQHDAVLRSMKERHEKEVQGLRGELDASNALAKQHETQAGFLREKLTEIQSRHDQVVKDRSLEIDELHKKYCDLQNKYSEVLANDKAVEINRLLGQLTAAEDKRRSDANIIRKYQEQINYLKSEVSGYEAMSVEEGGGEASDSIIALGLSHGISRQEDSNLRIREELARSLAGSKAKREEIARMEEALDAKDQALSLAQNTERRLVEEKERLQRRLEQAEQSAAASLAGQQGQEQLQQAVDQLQEKLAAAEADNIQVKKCMSEMLEGNNQDKIEAIDSLREEYEEHCRVAVAETKSIMEGETRRLRIELDVYNKTLAELRRKLAEAESAALARSTEGGISEEEAARRAAEAVRSAEARLEADLEQRLAGVRSEVERLVEARKEAEWEARLAAEKSSLKEVAEAGQEAVKQNLRVVWEAQHKGDIEEAVARARLDWLKQLPEAQKEGGAARESIGQLENFKARLKSLTTEKEGVTLRLQTEAAKASTAEAEVKRLLVNMEDLRQRLTQEVAAARREAEERLGSELRISLQRQQEQWERIVRSSREESGEQRHQLTVRFEEQMKEYEEKLKQQEAEKIEIENKLEQVETEFGLGLEKWRKVLEDKNRTIERLRTTDTDIELLKTELKRRVEETDRQKKEMTAMLERWSEEARTIQEAHAQERRELEETREKYRGLKSKVRKYQRHVEQKENHYKEEYSRLEGEFRGTLERLKERMELAYSAKEKEVEKELGTMREQFTQELRNIAVNNKRREDQLLRASAEDDNAVVRVEDEDGVGGQNGLHSLNSLNSLNSLEPEDLKRYYAATSDQLKKLLK